MNKPGSVYLTHERKIASGEGNSVVERWRYGRRLVLAKAGGKQLPHGLIDGLIADAAANGFKISRREIQNRIRLAEAYESAAHVRTAVRSFRSWTDLRDAGFPAVDVDPDLVRPEDLDDLGMTVTEPIDWEQPMIPGFGETVSVGGQKIDFASASVGEVDAYYELYARIHDGFAKKLAKMGHSRQLMHEGCDGDKSMNAVEAWKRGMKQYLDAS